MISRTISKSSEKYFLSEIREPSVVERERRIY